MKPVTQESLAYASFWKRLYAYGYDSLLVLLLTFLTYKLAGSAALAQPTDQVNAQIQAMVQAGLLPPGTEPYNLATVLHYQLAQAFSWSDFVVPLAVSAAYNIVFACSRWQATPGKRFCGIYITTKDGRKLTLLQSILRHVATGPSMLLGGLPYITIFFSREKCAPHDMLCGTRVVRGKVA